MSDSGVEGTVNETIAIIGPGALGLSLARWAAERGLQVALAGRDLDHASRSIAEAEQLWKKAVEKGRISAAQFSEASGLLRPCGAWEQACEGASWVVEALPESLPAKAALWARLEAFLPASVSRLTGTSSIPISAIRAAARMDSPLFAFHCFLPLERMPIIEVASEQDAPVKDLERALDLATKLGKRVARVKDQGGFAAARMALAQGLEAMRLLETGIASAEDLDDLMVGGYGHPAGPLELSDRVGLDLRLAISLQIFDSSGDVQFEPPAILRRLVAEGRLGLKTGSGFFEWDGRGRRR